MSVKFHLFITSLSEHFCSVVLIYSTFLYLSIVF
nr:MAG TPA: hypothetical protein [Caudoviricetes sp.]